MTTVSVTVVGGGGGGGGHPGPFGLTAQFGPSSLLQAPRTIASTSAPARAPILGIPIMTSSSREAWRLASAAPLGKTGPATSPVGTVSALSHARFPPVDEPRPRLGLATRAEIAVHAAHARLADLGSAPRADGLAADLQEVPHLGLDGLVAAPHLVGGRAHHGDDGGMQASGVVGAEGSAPGLGMDAGLEEDLVRVGVAEAVQCALVHHEGAHLVAAAAQALAERLQREGGGQHVHPTRLHAGNVLPLAPGGEVRLTHLLVVEIAEIRPGDERQDE